MLLTDSYSIYLRYDVIGVQMGIVLVSCGQTGVSQNAAEDLRIYPGSLCPGCKSVAAVIGSERFSHFFHQLLKFPLREIMAFPVPAISIDQLFRTLFLCLLQYSMIGVHTSLGYGNNSVSAGLRLAAPDEIGIEAIRGHGVKKLVRAASRG